MTIELRRLISELRGLLPAPVHVCKQALVDTKGNLQDAHAIVVRQLTDSVVRRTGLPSNEALTLLVKCGFDLERAIDLWGRDNPPAERPARERLESGIALAAEIQTSDSEMRCIAHVIPLGNARYELRLLKHDRRFTESDYGYDYDYALEDSRTRVLRLYADNIQETFNELSKWGVSEQMLRFPGEIDSCIVNSTIDTYLVPGRLPHLWLDGNLSSA